MSNTAQVIVQEATKAAPVITVQGMQLFGLPLNDVVQLCTLLYLALQGGYLLWKWRKESNKDE